MDQDAATVGATGDVTRPGAGETARRTPPGDVRHRSGGWLSSADSISHGRFTPGTILDSRYRIIGLLGRGGMGEVYRADDLRLGQPVALKFLPEDLGSDPVRLARFHNEVRVARQVSHPSVCRVYDIGDVQGVLYLSMEYVDGEDLATSLRRIGRFPEDKAIDIARQLCAGLSAAHQRGVIHRDLKPANIMLDGAGRVRVMDFGLAVIGAVDDVRAGTPAYMAPEQLLGREVTIKSDLFALGLVLYELFTGRRAFTATTVGELVGQHESRSTPAPSEIVPIDPAVERAILRCLEREPDRRPPSALAVAAALPGGDPLAAALAAGETPSPEMVAAAGEGAGLSTGIAWLIACGTLAGIIGSIVLALRTSPIDRIRPEYSAPVLAQKARDMLAQLGYPERPRDTAYGFLWSEAFIDHVRRTDTPAPRWDTVLTQRPSPLTFWYRQAPEGLVGLQFHSDLLTPGLVDADDPPPITSGMVRAELDHRGLLTYFEAIPPQRLEAPVASRPVDWMPLFRAAGLDPSGLQPAEPLWTWLATSDTRAAWTGTWPESGRPLRIEAAALGGRPVAFLAAGPWRVPWRMPDPSAPDRTTYFVVLGVLALAILAGGGMLARRQLQAGRGDRRGATRLAAAMTAILLALWASTVHVASGPGVLGTFLVAICTSVFYGVLLWMLYLALEPFVRRYWPQVLVSWTNVLAGRLQDPVVGRDVLIGIALGVWFTLAIRVIVAWTEPGSLVGFPGEVALLLGVRSTSGVILEEALYAIRNVLLYFFVLFALRVVLKNRWLVGVAFTGLFMVLNALDNDRPWAGAVLGMLYFGTAAFATLRWGLLTFVVGAFISALLFDLPMTLDTSLWYFGNMMLLIAIVTGLTLWSFHASVSGRLWGSVSGPGHR